MKKIGFWAILLLFISSCTNNFIDEDIEAVPQKEVKLKLNLNVEPMVTPDGKKVSTKADFKDNLVTNLWVVQYTSSGSFMAKRYYDKIADISTLEISVLPTPIGSTSTKLYFLANMGTSLNINYGTEGALKSKIMTTYYLVGDDGNFYPPMSASYSGDFLSSGIPSLMNVILKRTVARVDINYTTAAQLNLLRYELHNVQKYMPCFPSIVMDPANKESDYATDYLENSSSVDLTSSSGTVSFYLPPNYHGNGAYTGALASQKIGKDLATYIDFVTQAPPGIERVVYRIYPGRDNLKSCNLEANVKYTYNLDMKYNQATEDKRVFYPDRSNCYILEYGTGANSQVNVPIARMNQSALHFQADPYGLSPSQVQILWQSSANLITVNTDNLSKGYYTVIANSGTTDGNAVVAVKDASGKILWTWHFWVLSSAVNPTKVGIITAGYYDIMALNLGATRLPSASDALSYTGGLLYQWGRKDPFMLPSATLTGYTQPSYTSPTLTNGTPAMITNDGYSRKYTLGTAEFANQLEISVRYPLLHLTGWMGSTAINGTTPDENGGTFSWGGERHYGKTVYDPCPLGWRVPRNQIGDQSGYYLCWGAGVFSSQPSATATTTNFGVTAELGKVPMSGQRLNTGEFSYYQLRGFLWSATRTNLATGYNYCGYNSNVTISGNVSCDSALPVRCVKERM